jgi:uncharacterized protein involved in outer membrane biogenesis
LARLLVTLASLLALAIAAAFVAPAFTDWNAYRPDIEQAASAILGRKISIGGAIDIVLLPEPHFRAADVVAEGGARDGAQLRADAVDLSLSLQSLLAGRIEASRLKLVRPFLVLDWSKPIRSQPQPAQAGAIPIAADVSSLEIEGGRVSIVQDASRPEALTLEDVDGTLSTPAPGNPYRFNGRLSQDNRRFEVKFVASAAPKSGVKLAGSVLDLASRIAFHADGVLSADKAPAFEGAVAITSPQTPVAAGAPEAQAKAIAKIGLSGASLSDVVVTVDADNRPQVLLGSASIAFPAKTAYVALQARSLDADILLASGARLAPAAAGQSGMSRLLWLFPEFGLRLSLAADQVQYKGELIEGVKFNGARSGGSWAFEDFAATLPGDAKASASGSLTQTGAKLKLDAEAGLQGKNLGRLARWLSPAAANARPSPAKAFSVKGTVALSEEAAAFTNVAGDIEGIPFAANLRLERTPVRKLEVSLSGENFDLRSLQTSPAAAPLSAEGLKTAWQDALAQAAPFLGGDAASFEIADIDVSAGAIRTSFIDAKNVAARLTVNRDVLIVTKLNLETQDGLALSAQGLAPLRGAGQGRLNGRIEARTPQALLKAAAFAGYGAESLEGRRLEEFAPASLRMNYGAEDGGAATAQLSGAFGAARVEGRAELKGALADWRTGQLSAQLDVAESDGNRLVALLFPGAVGAPGAAVSPGSLTVRAEGASQRYAVTGVLKSAMLQAQAGGTAELKEQGAAFTGKTEATSPAPEQFLAPALLALLGGEPKAVFHVETDLAIAPGQAAATKLKAEAPGNLVTGSLGLAFAGGATRIDADLKAGQISLPALMSRLLTQTQADRLASAIQAATGAAASEIWSGQPFALGVFQNTAANLALSARTLKLGENFSLSDAQFAGKLESGRLDIRRLEGKALGGQLAATLALDAASGTAVSADARVSLSGADLSQLPLSGTPPLLTGKASLTLTASGRGLSPRGLISVLQGRGALVFTDGQLLRFAPAAVQKAADELLASPQPLTEDAVKKKAGEAAQSGDLKFRHLTAPLTIRDGMLEARRASFRGRDGTVRTEAFVDLSSLNADTTWQLGVGSDKRAKWPPMKIQISGPLRELGAKPRALAAEDYVRAVLIRKMEGDITRLESLNRPSPPSSSWTPKQDEQPKPPRRKRAQETPPPPAPQAPAGGLTEFERRMRDALQSRPQ